MITPDFLVEKSKELYGRKDQKSVFKARQLLFNVSKTSDLVEHYLYDNQGRPQKLDNFPMMRYIYNNISKSTLLKCSRKVLKSTLISNLLVLQSIKIDRFDSLYLTPSEQQTKGFSAKYLSGRFDTGPISKMMNGFDVNDVFNKILSDTKSGILLSYAKNDASRLRGPHSDFNMYDEVQGIDFDDVLPIAAECMGMSDFKYELFSGTPLSKGNTIERLWQKSTAMEYAVKCEGCNSYNMIIDELEPIKMIRPEGLGCYKCSKILDTTKGDWVTIRSNPHADLRGYHLCQPIIPHYNQRIDDWKKIYEKVHHGYSMPKTYNEIFGLSVDVGLKPITEDQLKSLCVLGPMIDKNGNLGILENQRLMLTDIKTVGVDNGVNMNTSITVVCMGAMRNDGVFIVYYLKLFKDLNYLDHLNQLAKLDRKYHLNSKMCIDAGPDPVRGHHLVDLTSPERTWLVEYSNLGVIQKKNVPTGAVDHKETRWKWHKSDTLGFIFRKLNESGKILFPRWEDVSEAMQHIMNVDVEMQDNGLRQSLFYVHSNEKPDDALQALNYCVSQAFMLAGDPLLSGISSTSGQEDEG